MIKSLFKFAIVGSIVIAILLTAYEVHRHHGMRNVSWAGTQEDLGIFVSMAQSNPKAPFVGLAVLALVLRNAIFGGAGFLRLFLMAASALGVCVGWAWWSAPVKVDPTLNWVMGLDYSAAYSGLAFGAPLLAHSCAAWLATIGGWGPMAKAAAGLASVICWAKFGSWLAGPTLAELMANRRTWGIGHWAGAIVAGAAAAALGAALVSAIPDVAPSAVLGIPKELRQSW